MLIHDCRKLYFLFLLLVFVIINISLHAKESTMIYVSFWFDTEDYILPQSDDAAKRIADIFSERKVQATFKIVGEKASILDERDRNDVIVALSKHDIGYHTTHHSIHPTPSEYCRDLSWDEGVYEFTTREEIGLEWLEEVFGESASCYGQPGGSWTPQSYAALREWNIPLYLDATSHVNLNNRPFWYCGILNVLELGECLLWVNGWTDDSIREFCRKFDQAHEKLTKEGGGVISVFYHPCEFVHETFWDGVNFAKGANPPRTEWKLPPVKSKEEQEQAYHVLEEILDYTIKQPNVRLVTARQISSLYPDSAYTEPLGQNDLKHIAESWKESISFADLGDRTVSAAEALFAFASLVITSDYETPPEDFDITFSYGPATRAERFITEGVFSWEDILETSEEYIKTITATEKMPTVIWVGGQPVRPEDFAATLAHIVPQILDETIYDQPIPFVQGKLEAEKYVADDDMDGLWGWEIFPEGFHAPKMMEIAKLQAWTIKPAKFRK